MSKKGEKKGISQIILTVILIAVSLIAIGIIWAVINGLILRNSKDISSPLENLGVSPPPTKNVLYNHSYTEIQPCDEGEILKTIDGTWVCTADLGTLIENCDFVNVSETDCNGDRCCVWAETDNGIGMTSDKVCEDKGYQFATSNLAAPGGGYSCMFWYGSEWYLDSYASGYLTHVHCCR